MRALAKLKFAALTLACLMVYPTSTAFFGGSAAHAAPDNGDRAPNRQPGLWEQQLTLDDGAYAIPTSRMCIDAAVEPRLTLVGAQMDRSKCATYSFKRAPDGTWSFLSVCTLGGGATATTTGSASGDFRTSYFVQSTGVTTGAQKAEMNATHHLVIRAEWLGACTPGMTGGDVATAGKTTNVFTAPPR